MKPIDQMAFMVRLTQIDLKTGLSRLVLKLAGDVVERLDAVNLRLARSEQVEVRPVQDIDQRWRGHGAPLYDGRGATGKELGLDHETISIRVNGQHRRVRDGMSVADLALELGLEPTKVAVERNLEIVPRSTLADVAVKDGDDFEIVTFVGGG